MRGCTSVLRCCAFWMKDEVVEHLLGHFEVGDHAVFHGLDNPEIAGRTAQHLLGFLADRLDFAGTVVESNGRGLVDYDALVPGIDPRVNRAQVNRQVRREQAQQWAQIVEGNSGYRVETHITNRLSKQRQPPKQPSATS